jgi:hypothetical protein
VGFPLAMALLLQESVAVRGKPRPVVGLEVAAYRSAEVFDVAATGFDVAQTWRGLGWHNPREMEVGDARWFVNPHSQLAVSAFLVAQEALVVYLAARLERRRGWERWAAPVLLGFEAMTHVEGGISWYGWRRYNVP